MEPKLCLVLCENFTHEAEAVIKDERFKDVEICSFKASCDHPYSSWASLIDQSSVHQNDYSHIYILGGYCVAGLENLPDRPNRCHCHAIDHCIRFLAGDATVDHYLAQGAFLLTPGWLRNWKERLAEWGFGEKPANEFFREFARVLVLLDTGIDRRSPDQLREFARSAGLPHEILPVGLDFYRLFLLEIVMAWRLGVKEAAPHDIASSAAKRLADYAMVFELIGRLASLDEEEKAIERIMDIFSMFCAPSHVFYLPLLDGVPGKIRSLPAATGDAEEAKGRLLNFQGEHGWTADQCGFRLRLVAGSVDLGILEINNVALPEFVHHYRNLGIAIVGACALAIHNSRIYDRLQKTLADLKAAHMEVNTLRGIIPICSSCKKIRDDEGFWQQVEVYVRNHSEADFSHGFCPECFVKLYPGIGEQILKL
jgi:hypothetical protein